MSAGQDYTQFEAAYDDSYAYTSQYGGGIYVPQPDMFPMQDFGQSYDNSASASQLHNSDFEKYIDAQLTRYTPLERSYSDQSNLSLDTTLYDQDVSSAQLERCFSNQSNTFSESSIGYGSNMLVHPLSRSCSIQAVNDGTYNSAIHQELQQPLTDQYLYNYNEYDANMAYSQSPTSLVAQGRADFSNLPSKPGHSIVSHTCNSIDCECGTQFKGGKMKNVKSNYKRHLITLDSAHYCEHCNKVFKRGDNLKKHKETCRSR